MELFVCVCLAQELVGELPSPAGWLSGPFPVDEPVKKHLHKSEETSEGNVNAELNGTN